jgi:hypothetical protein
VNWNIFFIGIVYFISENLFYGWNIMPQSDFEVLADGINMIIWAMAARGTK